MEIGVLKSIAENSFGHVLKIGEKDKEGLREITNGYLAPKPFVDFVLLFF